MLVRERHVVAASVRILESTILARTNVNTAMQMRVRVLHLRIGKDMRQISWVKQ